MVSTRAIRWGTAVAIVCLGAAAPVKWSPDTGLIEAEAACADGTCCDEPLSDCIINNILTIDAYRKASGGSCKHPTQPAPPP
ncbi:hypothetical protein SAMN05216486_10720 [bacterium JGI 053]|jgi:hypothetical protein|nr:hypothetical protein SAMN05216486_10720 [bacterium JGI 053]